MTGIRLQRFDTRHLRDFLQPIAINTAALEQVEAETPPPPPPPVYNQADLEHAREAAQKIGYAEGFEAGLAQAATQEAARVKATMQAVEAIQAQLATLAASYQQLVNQQSADLTELVLMIARKVAGAALDTHAVAATQQLLQHCLPVIFAKPRVVIELSPALLEVAEPALANQLAQAGFNGDAVFRVGEGLDTHDMRVMWDNGQATRSAATLWQEIEALLQQVALTPTLTNETTNEIPTGETHG
jgi:flagellar assembly protein FliH